MVSLQTIFVLNVLTRTTAGTKLFMEPNNWHLLNACSVGRFWGCFDCKGGNFLVCFAASLGETEGGWGVGTKV